MTTRTTNIGRHALALTAVGILVAGIVGTTGLAGSERVTFWPGEEVHVMWEAEPAGSSAAIEDDLQIVLLSYTTRTSATDPDLASGRMIGDLVGTLQTRLLEIDQSEPVWRVTYDWTFDSGADSFRANLAGTFDSEKDILLLRGTVYEGAMSGATLQSRGVLRNVATGFHEGHVRMVGASD